MSDIDMKIRDALRQEDAELFSKLAAEQSIPEMVLETFRGKGKWLTLMCVVIGIAFMTLGVISIINLLSAEGTRELVIWAVVFFFSMMAVAGMKIWYWMELNKIVLIREIKRVELQMALLAKRIEGKAEGTAVG